MKLTLPVPSSIDVSCPELALEVEWEPLIPADRYSPEEGGMWLPLMSSIRRVDGLATGGAVEDWLLTGEFMDVVQRAAEKGKP